MYSPGPHSLHSVAWVSSLNQPFGQSLHSPGAGVPSNNDLVLAYAPLPQGPHSTAPFGENLPESHILQSPVGGESPM